MRTPPETARTFDTKWVAASMAAADRWTIPLTAGGTMADTTAAQATAIRGHMAMRMRQVST